MKHQADLQRVVQFYETLTATSVAGLAEIYAADAWFKDPFNEVTGIVAIEAIFRHMFVQVEAPRFVVTSHMVQGEQAFMTWDFLFRMRSKPELEQCIRGATHLHFAADGRVKVHRDYWDAAEELYEKIPLLGGLMRWLKRSARK